ARWVGRWEGKSRTETGAIVRLTTTVMVLTELLALPANYYLGFVREHRWGLSVQPLGGWIKDYLLGFVIGWASNLFIILVVVWLIRRAARRWWLATGIALTIFGAIFTLLYPVLIDPLFVEREPMQDPQVLAMAQRLADHAGAKLDGVFLEKASLKTNRANAMVTGLGPTKRIIIWDTLLRDYPPEEVESVVAHELGHAIYRDVFWSWVGSSLAAILGSWLVARILGTPQQAGGLSWTRASQPRVVVAALLLLSLISTLSAPVMNTVTRVVEARADRFALDITANPQAFIQSEVRLALSNPSDYDPPKLLEWFRYTHPAAMNRVRAGERWIQEHR
ncbi:MAG: M48 family metallopeptidase, partial [Bacillota bacterium]